MSVLISRIRVHTLEHQQLLPEGEKLSGEKLDALISSCKTISFRTRREAGLPKAMSMALS